MDNNTIGLIFLLISSTFAISKSIDYDSNDVSGNKINDDVNSQSHDDYYGDYLDEMRNNHEMIAKRVPEIYYNNNNSNKRNIISALRSKMRRSNDMKPSEDVEDKFKFAPVLSVDALNNLNGFFDNLASNIHTMESRNLVPNQMRLLGESEYRPRTDPYSSSAAFINSIRSYAPTKSIRKLLSYQPGAHLHSHPLITNQIHRKDRS